MHADLDVGRAADVEERHRGEALDAGAEPEVTVVVLAVHVHVAVGQLDALGESGRARRIHDDHGVIRLDSRILLCRLAVRDPLLVFIAVVLTTAADDDDVLDAGGLIPDRLEVGDEVGADDDHLGCAVREDIAELLAEDPEVDDRVGRARAAALVTSTVERLFMSILATRSPRPMPRALSPPATRWTRSCPHPTLRLVLIGHAMRVRLTSAQCSSRSRGGP